MQTSRLRIVEPTEIWMDPNIQMNARIARRRRRNTLDAFLLAWIKTVVPLIADCDELILRTHEHSDVYPTWIPAVGQKVGPLGCSERDPCSGNSTRGVFVELGSEPHALVRVRAFPPSLLD